MTEKNDFDHLPEFPEDSESLKHPSHHDKTQDESDESNAEGEGQESSFDFSSFDPDSFDFSAGSESNPEGSSEGSDELPVLPEPAPEFLIAPNLFVPDQPIPEKMRFLIRHKKEEAEEQARLAAMPKQPYRRDEPRVGRNDPCPCGSGKKYKKCHMGKDLEEEA